jgi:aromatic ring-opening dioxygenase LigB subunit
MVLDGIYIFPHGTMILDIESPDMKSILPKKAAELHFACQRLADGIVSKKVDHIFLITPHGISLKEKLGIYGNAKFKGSAEWNGNWSNYTVEWANDVAISTELYSFLKMEDFPVEMITCFSQGCASQLAWGEVVPLWFCDQAFKSSPFRNSSRPTCSIISWPASRMQPLTFSETATRFGNLLAKFCHASLEQNCRYALVYSCDLSHVHSPPTDTHPLFLSPDSSLRPNEELAVHFDHVILDWINSLLKEKNIIEAREILRDKALPLCAEAKICGWSGFCCLQGILETYAQQMNESVDWSGGLYSYAAPTYYGMLVAGIQFKEQKKTTEKN